MPGGFRNISVAVTGDTRGLGAALRQGAREVDDFGNKVTAANTKASRSTDQVTASTKGSTQAVRELSLISAAAGAAILFGIGKAVSAWADFDKAMSGVKAVSGATAAQMDQLKDAAIVAGQATVFSASQSAEAEAELAKAGVSVKNILGGALTGSLNLAAAGQLDLADAATIAAQAMNIFKLKGSDVSHVADVLAAGANKSAADVGSLGEALRQGGLLAAQTGLHLEDTVGALSAFADSALVGSDAGTSLKTMLQRLTPQSAEAKSAMKSISFSAYDAQGNFVGLASVAQQLQAGLGKLNAEQRAIALSTIFGSDAVRAATVLYDQGAAGIKSYTDAVNDQGAASRMAATQLDNLRGDLEQFTGSLDTALIQTGSSANTSLRGITQSATGMVNAFGQLPGAVQGGATLLTAAAGTALLAAGAFGTMAPKVKLARAALMDMGTAGQFANRSLGLVGAAALKASLAVAAVTAVNAAFGVSASDLQFFGDKITAAAGPDKQTQIRALTTEMEKLRAVQHRGPDTDLFGLTDIHWTDWSGKSSDAGDKADSLAERIKKLKQELELAGISTDAATSDATDLGGAYGNVVAPAVTTATDALQAYHDLLADTVQVDAFTSAAELAKSFHSLTKELKDGGKVTDDEKITLGGFARDVRSTSAAVLDQTKSQTKANASMRDGRAQFVDLAEQAGYTAKQAKRLADRLLQIPARTDVTIDADITPALKAIRRLQRALEATGVGAAVSAGVAARVTANPPGAATGGRLSGPGTGTSDSLLIAASAGEWVMRERAASFYGDHVMSAINRTAIPRSMFRGIPGYRDGGAVMPRAAASSVHVVRVPLVETTNYDQPIHIANALMDTAWLERRQSLARLRDQQRRGRSTP